MENKHEQNYSKRELDHYFAELFLRLDKQDLVLSGIKDQKTEIHGRVTKLEFWISALKWTCGVLWSLILILIPILYHLQRLQSVADSHKAVRDVLQQYNIIYKAPQQ